MNFDLDHTDSPSSTTSAPAVSTPAVLPTPTIHGVLLLIAVILTTILVATPAQAWKLYNNANSDVNFIVYDNQGAKLSSGEIKAGKDSACNWSNSSCNPDGKRDSELLVVFYKNDINWSCSVTMLGGGFALVYRADRASVHPDLFGHLWCFSQINENHKGGNANDVDINGDGKKNDNAYYDIDWSDPYLVDDRDADFYTETRDLRFFVTADPQINNADLLNKNGEDGHCINVEKCKAASGTGAEGAKDTFKTIRNKLTGSSYGFARQNSKVRGVLVAGDLTQQSRWDEFKFYSQISTNEVLADMPPVEKIYEGLGNHDGLDASKTDCVEGADFRVAYCDYGNDIAGHVANHHRNDRMSSTGNLKQGSGLGAVPSGTPHYSWEWHDIHFVQLNLFPGYAATSSRPDKDPYGALYFLESDLADWVGTSGRPVVLVQHYGFDEFSTLDLFDCTDIPGDRDSDGNTIGGDGDPWWTEQNRIDFWDAIQDYNVVAIFTGHNHLSASNPRLSTKGTRDNDGDGVEETTCTDTQGWREDFLRPAGADSRADGRTSIPAFIAGSTGNGIYLDVTVDSCNQMTIDRMDNGTLDGTDTITFASASAIAASCNPAAVCISKQLSANGQCEHSPSLIGSGAIGTCTETPPAPYTLGTTIVDVDCTNGSSTDSCQATVEITDKRSPIIFCPTSQTYECGAAFGFQFDQPADNCDPSSALTVDCTPATTDLAAIGQNGVVCETMDSSGNSAQCASTHVVVDTLAPTLSISGPQILAHECAAAFTDPAVTAADQCEGALTATTSDVLDVFSLGFQPLTFEATDGSGNKGTKSIQVRVEDTTAPTVTLTGSATQTLQCNVDSYLEAGATSSDACSGSLAVTVGGATVDPSQVGTYQVTYDATDGAGLSGQAIRDVSVIDTLPPTITLLGDSPLVLECSVDSDFEPGATATDACSGPLTVTSSGAVSDTSVGVYPIQYQATDAAGLVANATRNVIVQDTIQPSIACDADIEVEPTSPLGATVTFGAISSDFCDPGPKVVCAQSGSVFAVGSSTQVSCVATDDAQLSNSCSLTVKVLSQEEVVAGIRDDVDELFSSGAVNGGQGNSLHRKLKNILRATYENRIDAACDQIAGLQTQLGEWVSTGVLTAAEALSLQNSATNLASTMSCAP